MHGVCALSDDAAGCGICGGDAAQTGTVTITLLEDATLDEDYSIVWESGVTKDITIAMGNHNVTGNGTLVIEDGTVHLTGSGTFGAPITYTGATLSLTEGWTGTASSITSIYRYSPLKLELSGGTVTDLTYASGDLEISDGEVGTLHVNTQTISTITGGHFGTITAGTNNVKFFPSVGNVFLSDGKPFNTIQAGESIYNVTLGACTHSDDNGDTICDYCHAVANVELYAADDTLRRGCFGITEALGYVQSGDTIRIGDNQTETATVDKNFPFVIHLSGNYLPGLTVNNDGLRLMGTMVDANNNTVYGSIGELSIPGSMIGSLPADGYSLAAYKDSSTLGTWLTADELLGNHATNVSVVKAAIEHVRVVNSVSVPYGTAPTFTAEVTSENTDGLTYQWYKLENGSWTAIFGANEKNYEPTGLNAGTYDFICAVTGADGATVLGNIGNVTVEPVSIAGATVIIPCPLRAKETIPVRSMAWSGISCRLCWGLLILRCLHF